MRGLTATATMRVVKSIEVPNLGERIRAARKVNRRTLKSICEEIGMTPMNWYRIEKEEQEITFETLRKIERVLNTSFDVDFSADA